MKIRYRTLKRIVTEALDDTTLANDAPLNDKVSAHAHQVLITALEAATTYVDALVARQGAGGKVKPMRAAIGEILVLAKWLQGRQDPRAEVANNVAKHLATIADQASSMPFQGLVSNPEKIKVLKAALDKARDAVGELRYYNLRPPSHPPRYV